MGDLTHLIRRRRRQLGKLPVQEFVVGESLCARQGRRAAVGLLHSPRPAGQEQGARPLEIVGVRARQRQPGNRLGNPLQHRIRAVRVVVGTDREDAQLGR